MLNDGDKGQLSLYLGTRWTVSPVFVNGIDGSRLVLDSGDSHGVSRTIYIYIICNTIFIWMGIEDVFPKRSH